MDYGHVEVWFLNPNVSDHSPIVIQVSTRPPFGPKTFRLFKTVLEHPKFEGILTTLWSKRYTSTRIRQLWRKLKALKIGLKDLNTYLASYSPKLQTTRQSLEIVQSKMKTQPLNNVLIEQELVLLSDIRKWSLVEEKVCKQKSRINWDNSGDANTKFFHAQMKIRSNKNTITSIYTSNVIKLQDPKLVEE
ncbi:hypothetical protein H5410_022569 [Solanum commersonii]|uniref:Uncharacterized protein n=1 Tax=Solanum commersonii TaxID=4109 RepID=A0A9J5ZHK0_SOLCO|nr:hypothetical protein H5410_022569 [Solanum commersonii]